MLILKGSTATIPILLVDSTDHVTAETGKAASMSVKLSKAGGAFAAATNTPTEISLGFYALVPTATETNTDGVLAVNATATGCDAWRDLHQVYTVIAANVAQIDGDASAAATLTETRIANLDDLDVAVSSRVAHATLTDTRAAKLDNLDVLVSSRVAHATLTDARAALLDNLDVLVSSRVAHATLTDARAALLDNLDVLLSSRVAHATLTDARAALLDNLDATVSSRTATATWTDAKAGYLDGAITGRAAAGDQMDLVNAPNSTAVAAIQSGLATPGAQMNLVDAPNATALDAMADAVLDEAYESTETFRQFLRGARAILYGKSTGGGTTTPDFRDRADAKNRVTFTVNASGIRSSVTTDLT